MTSSIEQLKHRTGLDKTKPAHERSSLVVEFGAQYQIDPTKVVAVLAATVFRASKQEDTLTLEEMQAALIVAKKYNLNPFTKEIYCFRSQGKLLIVVSVDGWCNIINRQESLDGIEFDEHFDEAGAIRAITCKIHRKDRRVPTVVTEYYTECKRNTAPWQQSPIRMLRHRALIQCARIAFSISGALDEDEAQSMHNGPLIEYAPKANVVAVDQQVVKSAPQLDPETYQWSAAASDLFDKLNVPVNQREVLFANCGSNDADLVSYLESQLEREPS